MSTTFCFGGNGCNPIDIQLFPGVDHFFLLASYLDPDLDGCDSNRSFHLFPNPAVRPVPYQTLPSPFFADALIIRGYNLDLDDDDNNLLTFLLPYSYFEEGSFWVLAVRQTSCSNVNDYYAQGGFIVPKSKFVATTDNILQKIDTQSTDILTAIDQLNDLISQQGGVDLLPLLQTIQNGFNALNLLIPQQSSTLLTDLGTKTNLIISEISNLRAALSESQAAQSALLVDLVTNAIQSQVQQVIGILANLQSAMATGFSATQQSITTSNAQQTEELINRLSALLQAQTAELTNAMNQFETRITSAVGLQTTQLTNSINQSETRLASVVQLQKDLGVSEIKNVLSTNFEQVNGKINVLQETVDQVAQSSQKISEEVSNLNRRPNNQNVTIILVIFGVALALSIIIVIILIATR